MGVRIPSELDAQHVRAENGKPACATPLQALTDSGVVPKRRRIDSAGRVVG